MNELKIFENPEFGEMRTIREKGEILFCAKDVAIALGYKDPNDAIKRHCPHAVKRRVGVQTGIKADGTPAFQKVMMSFIPESDVYRLIFGSKLPNADRFTDWVTIEVLPTLRKTGSYSMRPMTEYQEANIALQKDKLAFQRAGMLLQLAEKYDGTYRQILHAHATKEMTGEFLLPLPALEERTYSAQEVGDILGISANLVGRLANKCDLKDDAHGQWFKDKAKHSDKEVSSFRYYECAIDEMRQALERRDVAPPDGLD